MRQMLLFSALVAAGVGVLASPAGADMTGMFADSYGEGEGSGLALTPAGDYDGLASAPLPTFCLGTNDCIEFDSTFAQGDIGRGTNDSGSGGGDPDPLDERTSWLDAGSQGASLAAFSDDYYSTGSERVASADVLQQVIWALEAERDASWPMDNPEETWSLAADSEADDPGNVRVLNVEWLDGTPSQSQLALVPVPGAFLLGALGLGIVGFTKRRFVK